MSAPTPGYVCDRCGMWGCECPEGKLIKAPAVPVENTGEQPAKEGRVSDQQDETPLLPAPTNPMAVARRLLPAWQDKRTGGRTLRHWRGTWMGWQRSHWSELDDREIKAVVYKRLEHAVYEQITARGSDLRAWAPSKRKVSDLLEALAAITHLPSAVDAPSWTDGTDHGPIVACANGLLRVSDHELLEHSPLFLNQVSVPFDYDPAAEAPRWLKFLGELWPQVPGEDEAAQEASKNAADQIAALQEYFGYVVSGRTDLHKIMLIVGPTRSGKGTIARILTAMIGKGNMAGPTLAGLGTNFGLSPLLGKPLAIISDARLSGRDGHQVVERLLTISGEDTIDVDRKFKDPWTGRLPTRFLILSNELPNFGDASGTIARRFLVLTMAVSWFGQENKALTTELAAELPGILNWALKGLERLDKNQRFTEPRSSAEAVTMMQDTASPMSAFVRESCETGPAYEVTVDALFAAWKDWCEGANRGAGNKQMFGRNLQSVIPQARRTRPRDSWGKQVPTYSGVRLKAEQKQDENHNAKDATQRDSSDSETDLSRAESRHNPLWSSSEAVTAATGVGRPLTGDSGDAGVEWSA